MNRGTKIRTVLGVLTTINTVLAVTDITQFGNETVTFYYKLISVIVNAIVVGINTWYNNDYTEEACIGTGVTRQLKAEQKEDYIGDIFYQDDPDYIAEAVESDEESNDFIEEIEKIEPENEEEDEYDE